MNPNRDFMRAPLIGEARIVLLHPSNPPAGDSGTVPR